MEAQITVDLALAKKLAEENEVLHKREKALKRVRIGNIAIGCTGLLLTTFGYFFKKDDSIKTLGNILFYGGIGLTISSIFSLGFSISF